MQITYAGTGNYTTILYDAFGRWTQISETVANVTTETSQLIWSKGSMVPDEIRGNSGTTLTFGYGQRVAGTNYFYLLDHVPSVRGMIDSSQNVVFEASYDAYGVSKFLAPPIVEPALGYEGEYRHLRSGLALTSDRPYSARLGRYLSRKREKPGSQSDVNQFVFRHNEPVRSTINDAVGRIPFFEEPR